MTARRAVKAVAGRGQGRRVQAVLIFLVLLASTAAATVGLALVAVDSNGPFQRSFAVQRGADVVAGIDSARVASAQLAATGRLPGVTAAAGPFAETSATLDSDGSSLGTVTVAGRSSPGGPVDDLTLTAGQWPRRPGQIVIATDLGQGPAHQITIGIGSQVAVSTAPGSPRLTVVGTALSITDTAGAWVVPAELAALRTRGAPAIEQMLYRFSRASSAAQLSTDVAAVTAALPAGAIAGSASWLAVASAASGSSSIVSPFVVAFAIMGLVLSVLIVANVVSGVVLASYRRIGVLKSIGLTPAQVTVAYLRRAGTPALAGCALGAVAGRLLTLPVLSNSASVYGVGSQQVPPWVEIIAPLGMYALALLAAFVPAVRAGRLSAVRAIATGQAPHPRRGHVAHRLFGRMHLPRVAAIGLAAPFARPARTMVTLAAIAFGATAVIFAVGLDASLARAATGIENAQGPGQLVVYPPGQAFTPGQQRKAIAVIKAQPGTAHYVAEATPTVGVSGLTKQVNAEAFDGSAAWTDYDIVSGHWYSGAGQADVNTAFLSQTGLSVGDTTSVASGGKMMTVRIVGEVFDPNRQPLLIAGWQTLGGGAAGLAVNQYDIGLKPAVSLDTYQNSLIQALGPAFGTGHYGGGQFFSIAKSLVGVLTLLVAIVAGLGVLNTVLLDVRERRHDLGVFKALGMTPSEATGMIVCWVAVPAIAAAAIAAPGADILHSVTVRAMANAAGTAIPASFTHVLPAPALAALALSGLVIAAFGALLPGTWAARSPAATALRAE